MTVDWAGDDDTTSAVETRLQESEPSPFSSHLRHDIRGSATTIVWLASALGTGSVQGRERDRAVLGIVECAQMILELARDDTERTEKIAAVADMVRSAADRARLTHTVDVLVVDETADAFTTAPALDTARVIDNLLANACLAAGINGSVVIKIVEQRASIEIEIVDSGPGIDDAQLAGGLGLTIVAALVERLGGEFAIANLGGQGGTSARVVLPRHTATYVTEPGKAPT